YSHGAMTMFLYISVNYDSLPPMLRPRCHRGSRNSREFSRHFFHARRSPQFLHWRLCRRPT
ncbi:hypothetical protein Pmar_PMAR009699, partial [Perkinsus marinus ATCC 50983]